MPVNIGDAPQPDFDRPIELLMDCHRRVERFLEVLLSLATDHGDRPLDGEHREALETALNYFRGAAPMHTADEEQSLFPRMRDSGDPDARAAADRLAQLESDHHDADARHARVDALGRRWLACGQLSGRDADELLAHLRALAMLYAEHIRAEDEEIFPLAARTLNGEQLREVGHEMARRRAASPGREGSRCAARRLSSLGRSVE